MRLSIILISLTLPCSLAFGAWSDRQEFKGYYKGKLLNSFCHNSEFANCFVENSQKCKKQFTLAFERCFNREFPQRKIAAEDLAAEKFSVLGACIGHGIYKAGASSTCKVLPAQF